MVRSPAPDARRKGRLQEGADADVVVFDPSAVQDRASHERPAAPSAGFRYVLVAGTPVVDGGKLVEGTFPGKPLLRGAR
jgi:N-acyl-D-glutamate deacylase